MGDRHERGDAHEVRDAAGAYAQDAHALAEAYESVPFEAVHAPVLDLLPEPPAAVLDVGAGSGRDAAWLAERGHEVVAVEPVQPLRAEAERHHPSPRIRWLDDALPDLARVRRSGCTFDLVWVSAVWMHVAPGARTRAFRKLVSLLRPGGAIMISLRQGPPPRERPMAPASAGEVEALARRHGLLTVRSACAPDALGRTDVRWEVLWLQLPDDGTGALPLLRHVIYNDPRSSTYKLALLRVLVRIADGAAGLAREGESEDVVDLPLGLVALYWIRVFRPLLDDELPQRPRGNDHLGFVKKGFRCLATRSPYDLRAGRRFEGPEAANLIAALRDAAACIRRMPATYITYPGSNEAVFPCRAHGPVRTRERVELDEPFLWSLGTLSVPRHLWQAMGRYAAWIEPAIVNEWTETMRGYEGLSPIPWDTHLAALRWLDPRHDTALVRGLAQALQASGRPLFCTWTGRRLRRDFAIDHCFPFAAWPCNDLWNLVPTAAQTNQHKRDRLPGAELLETAKPRVIEWWEAAYSRNDELAERFTKEALAALPGAGLAEGRVSGETLFEGVMLQRAVLRRDQQLAEWVP